MQVPSDSICHPTRGKLPNPKFSLFLPCPSVSLHFSPSFFLRVFLWVSLCIHVCTFLSRYLCVSVSFSLSMTLSFVVPFSLLPLFSLFFLFLIFPSLSVSPLSLACAPAFSLTHAQTQQHRHADIHANTLAHWHSCTRLTLRLSRLSFQVLTPTFYASFSLLHFLLLFSLPRVSLHTHTYTSTHVGYDDDCFYYFQK